MGWQQLLNYFLKDVLNAFATIYPSSKQNLSLILQQQQLELQTIRLKRLNWIFYLPVIALLKPFIHGNSLFLACVGSLILRPFQEESRCLLSRRIRHLRRTQGNLLRHPRSRIEHQDLNPSHACAAYTLSRGEQESGCRIRLSTHINHRHLRHR